MHQNNHETIRLMSSSIKYKFVNVISFFFQFKWFCQFYPDHARHSNPVGGEQFVLARVSRSWYFWCCKGYGISALFCWREPSVFRCQRGKCWDQNNCVQLSATLHSCKCEMTIDKNNYFFILILLCWEILNFELSPQCTKISILYNYVLTLHCWT